MHANSELTKYSFLFIVSGLQATAVTEQTQQKS